MTAQRAITRIQDADDITGALSDGDSLVYNVDGTFHPAAGGGGSPPGFVFHAVKVFLPVEAFGAIDVAAGGLGPFTDVLGLGISYTFDAGDRVLVGMASGGNFVLSGIWEARAGAWTRPSDWADGDTIDVAQHWVAIPDVNPTGAEWDDKLLRGNAIILSPDIEDGTGFVSSGVIGTNTFFWDDGTNSYLMPVGMIGLSWTDVVADAGPGLQLRANVDGQDLFTAKHLADPVDAQDAATMAYSDAHLLGRTVTGTDGSGKGWVSDGSGGLVWTDIATQGELDTHAALTTTAHGGLVASSDARLSDTRTPTDATVTDAKIATTLSPSKIAGTAVITTDSRLSDTRTPTDGSVTAAKVNTALKPSGSAATSDEALRALGTGAGNAAAGNDSRLSDTRTPTDGSVTAAKVNTALKPSGSAATSDEALRALGTGAGNAAAGNDSRFPAGADIVAGDMAAGAAVANIGSHGVTSLLLAAEFLALPRLLTFGTTRLGSAVTAADYALWRGGGGNFSATTSPFSAGQSGSAIFYFDPALYALTGLTTKMIVNATCLTNATAPTVNFTVGLFPITSVAGSSGNNTVVVGTVTSGSTVAFNTPGASGTAHGNSGAFSVVAAGYYALGVTVSGTSAASSTEDLTADLLLYWV